MPPISPGIRAKGCRAYSLSHLERDLSRHQEVLTRRVVLERDDAREAQPALPCREANGRMCVGIPMARVCASSHVLVGGRSRQSPGLFGLDLAGLS